MSSVAVALVLVAAGIHASWNLLFKRAGGSVAFLWLFMGLSAALYAPAAAIILILNPPSAAQAMAMAGTGVLHVAYSLMLGRAYEHGDLSVVYPLARGTGPLLATALAIPLLGERPSAVALAGAACVILGVFLLAGDGFVRWGLPGRHGARYALLTGATIALYTVWDKYAVSTLEVSPLVQVWAATAGPVVLLAPMIARRWSDVRAAWKTHRDSALIAGLLAPVSYMLVLAALVFAPVSLVAPLREVSVLISVALGRRVLSETQGLRRGAAAAAMIAGILALTIE